MCAVMWWISVEYGIHYEAKGLCRSLTYRNLTSIISAVWMHEWGECEETGHAHLNCQRHVPGTLSPVNTRYVVQGRIWYPQQARKLCRSLTYRD
jgi:hypothetical protein